MIPKRFILIQFSIIDINVELIQSYFLILFIIIDFFKFSIFILK